jgi:general secretion pathway protein B
MSYILDALKKSDQQRQRGTTPTLQAAQVTVATPQRPLFIYYSLLAAVLLVAGIMIGWLRPWQPERPSSQSTIPGAEPIAAESPIPIPQQAAPAPLPAPPEMHSKTATPGAVAPVPDKPIPDKPAKLADAAQEQKAIRLDELPLAIQQEIPAMAVQLHAYSSKPSERLVSINSIRLREGESLMLGLRLEQVTPDGMIFSYKGYRFQRGIR